METAKRPDILPNMKSIFILTDIVIPVIAAAIASWVGIELLEKWEENRSRKKANY